MSRSPAAALLSLALLAAPAAAQQSAVPDGPIAFIGHGAMFDRDGREIAPTPELVAEALAFYREALLGLADQATRDRFGTLESEVVAAAPEALAAGAPARPVADAVLLDWLVDAVAPADGGRLGGKVNLLKSVVVEGSAGSAPQARASVALPSGVRERLEATVGSAKAAPSAEAATSAGGEAYTQLCKANGVPIPPDWKTSGWQFRGVLENEFISAGLKAEVFTYRSTNPDGVCFALPRFNTQANHVQLLGVICLGRQSGKVCFWDNQKNGVQFFPKPGEVVPFAQFSGGSELLASVGGICTDCHAGENPYVIHPGTVLGLPNLADLPLFPDDWHQPLVQPGWPLNPGPLQVTGDCAACHVKGGPGGRLPAVSTLLSGYCGAVLDTALERTMPPGALGSQQCPPSQGSCPPHVQVLQKACEEPPKSAAWAGAIWRFIGQPCSGAWCPGWQKLDNNFRTVAIAAARDNLYQLHYDGSVWRFTGQPCSGTSCPGWEKLDNNFRTVAIASASGKLYQLHRDGSIFRYTGQPCSRDSCPGWQRLDRNAATIAIVAHGANGLYQLHGDGKVWEFTGTVCTGASCPGWRKVDDDREIADISLANGKLQKRQRDGEIFRYDGGSCSGATCTGWTRIDAFPSTVAIVGGDYQIHDGGALFRSTGAPFGWQKLDDNARTAVAVQAEGVGQPLYQLHAAKLFQRHVGGAIWQSQGHACAGDSCGGGWQQLDNFAGTGQIAASAGRLFQRHKDGAIYQSTGEPCIAGICNGWRQLDRNPATKSIASGGGQLYQLHQDGKIWRHRGPGCSAPPCAWELLDVNPATVAIVAGGGELYQKHGDGKVYEATGVPCNAAGTSCPGWRRLDNPGPTAFLAAAGGQLYQTHGDGHVFRSDGRGCSGGSCTGWHRLDNNPSTVAIEAARD
jgi:hypothetical protein